jgi:putative hemolysin
MSNKLFAIILIILFVAPLTLLAAEASIATKRTEGALTGFAQKFKDFDTNFIGFLQWLFPVMLSVSAILAVLTLIFAGFKWMAGAISPPQVDEAKKMIAAAIGGLALALSSWLILSTINPKLISLQKPENAPTTFKPPIGEFISSDEIKLEEFICINKTYQSIVSSTQTKCVNKGGILEEVRNHDCPVGKTAFLCRADERITTKSESSPQPKPPISGPRMTQ